MKTSSYVFRSGDHWKSALMILPDNRFFELLRSVFGDIKTPFNKQKLLEDLFALLSRSDIRNTVAAYINRQDHKIIAALALLNEPDQPTLDAFFEEDISRAELKALLVNLEERLILYRYRDEGILRLALNPVLESVLAPFADDPGVLFPFFEKEQDGKTNAAETAVVKTGHPETPAPGEAAAFAACLSDGRVMAALFTFILSQEELSRPDGKIRKKVLEESKKLFPRLDFEAALKITFALGLFEGQEPLPNFPPAAARSRREKTAAFCALSAAERQEYWAAGLYLCQAAGEGELFPLSRNALRSIAGFIRRFRLPLVPGALYPEITLRRLWLLLEQEENSSGYVWGEPFADKQLISRQPGAFSFEAMLGVMEKTGMLEKREKRLYAIPPAEAYSAAGDFPAKEPVIVMDTAFSFLLYPEISFADAVTLGSFCAVKNVSEGAAVCFELNRLSAVRAFDRGMTSGAMTELLDRLSGNRIDANLGWTLREWEKRYYRVSLYRGVVLALSEEERYLAEAEPVARLVHKTLAPGVYLLSGEDYSPALAALKKAGVDIVAQPESAAAAPEAGRRYGNSRDFFPALEPRQGVVSPEHTEAFSRFSFFKKEKPPETETSPCSAGPEEASASAAIKEKFRAILDGMKLTKPEREELLARIDRRLVLSAAQLEKTLLRYEKLEASGLDYSGKSLIAKQAVETGSLLEVSWRGSGGTMNRVSGTARSLVKKEGETVLVLKCENRPAEGGGDYTVEEDAADASADTPRIAGDTLHIPLGKISLLRRIKQSIFGG